MNNKLSPHVTIYKFPITAISSIATRLSGLYMTSLFVSGGMICALDKKEEVYKKYHDMSMNIKKVFHYSIIAPLTYHTYGGIRHFIWDRYPSFLNNKSVAKSSYFLFGASFISTIAIENAWTIIEKYENNIKE